MIEDLRAPGARPIPSISKTIDKTCGERIRACRTKKEATLPTTVTASVAQRSPISTGAAGDGGAGGAINVTSADAGNDQAHDVTLNAVLTALGGQPDGAGTTGVGATVTIVSDGRIVDGLATAAVDVAGRRSQSERRE